MGNKDITKIKAGDKVAFNSGNFSGLTGEVIETGFNSTNPIAIYGILHKVKLSNGQTGYIEKSEHWNFINT
jgi:ribosomal protein L24